MEETYDLLSNRKQIPVDLGHVPPPLRLDVLEAVGTSMTRPAWQEILNQLPVEAQVRVLLLDPAGRVLSDASSAQFLLWDSVSPLRERIAATATTLADTARSRGFSLELRFYDQPPVSRYVYADGRIYQAHYPRPGRDVTVPVAVLGARSVLGRRAQREFMTVWKTRSRPGMTVAAADKALADSSPFGSQALAIPPPNVSAARGEVAVRLVANRKAVPADLSRGLRCLREVDVIDVAAAAQVDCAWVELLRCFGEPPVRLRVLLLCPDGTAAACRACESTRWQGDDAGLRAKIRRNIGRLEEMASALGADLSIRVYDMLPISRYIRADDTIYQSVYPSDSSAKSEAIAVIPRGSMLGQR